MKNFRFIRYLCLWLLFPVVGQAATEPDWNCDIHAYQYDMSLYITLQQNGTAAAGDWAVAAFCGEECRGIAKVQTIDEATFFYLRIRSNQESGETLSFKLFDRLQGKELAPSATISFAHLTQIGYPSQPWVLTIPALADAESGLEHIDENTEEIVLTGTWSQEQIDALAEKIRQGDGATNEKLTTVDMSDVTFDENVSLQGLFADCSHLTSVILPDLPAVEQLADDTFAGANPNCLVFVPEAQTVPQAWSEQVNVVKDGTIDQLTLVEGKPFNSPRSFLAQRAVYRRTFTNKQQPKDNPTAKGWETICLPFDVDVVMYEGEQLYPVSAAGAELDGDFHLASLTERGFELYAGNDKNHLQANTPYMINMVSAQGEICEGDVLFIANGEVRITATQPYCIQENAQQRLTGVFKKINLDLNMYMMNEDGNGFVAGEGANVNPFEAFLQTQNASSSFIPFVLYIPATGIQLSVRSLTIKVGNSTPIVATVTPDKATNKQVTWSSSNRNVATVTPQGIVTGVKKGTATITAQTAEGDIAATCQVTVTDSDAPQPEEPTDPEAPGDTEEPDEPETPDAPTANETLAYATLKVYPTGVKHYVHIGILPGKSRLTLFSITGKVMKQLANCEGTVDLYMGELPSGLYLLHVETEAHPGKTYKLIKSN